MRRPRVLIADDDAALRKVLALRLDQAGFDVATCSDGYTASLMLDGYTPDLVILDINMPAGSGFSVHRHMRRRKQCQHTPVIYLTGEQKGGVLNDARARGPAAVITKPYELNHLFDVIDRCIRKSHSGSN